MTEQQKIEQALGDGKLWAAMRNGNYWLARRNGATKTWKTRPGEFSIPVKAGLHSCARIGPGDLAAGYFVISDEKPR